MWVTRVAKIIVHGSSNELFGNLIDIFSERSNLKYLPCVQRKLFNMLKPDFFCTKRKKIL